MLDRRRRDELQGVLNLGRLADQMVFALGRAVRDEPLLPEDIELIERAKQLFELMATEDVIVVAHSDDRMLNDDSYLDALHVVELRAEDADVEANARRYIELLQKVVESALDAKERDELVGLRDLFAEVGEATLARAGELSRPRQESAWRQMRPATSNF